MMDALLIHRKTASWTPFAEDSQYLYFMIKQIFFFKNISMYIYTLHVKGKKD